MSRSAPDYKFDLAFIGSMLRSFGYGEITCRKVGRVLLEVPPPKPPSRLTLHNGADRKSLGRPRKPPVLTVVAGGVQ